MQKYIRVSFLYFFLAACIGLLLRWHFINPISWLTFPFWLHAHSHLMFLGWIFNLLSIAFVQENIKQDHRKKYTILFMIIQVLLMGMLISFPLQGYGVYSIALSTLHTVLVGVFSFWFFQDTKNIDFDPSRWFARISLIFFLVSSIGPFALGALMANGFAQTKWYYFSVYYYLHFQYNGVFTFGVFSLFFSLLRERGMIPNQFLIKRFGYLMLISCFLAYSLSTLWATPGLVFNVLGLVATLMQLVALTYFLKIVRSIPITIIRNVSQSVRILFMVAFLAFISKLILQTLSAHSSIAQLAYENRNYVMAYLHLVLLGIFSCFLLGWSIEKKWIKKPSQLVTALFLIGFVGMELTLISRIPTGNVLINSSHLLFLFSLMIASGVGVIFINTLIKRIR